MEALRWSMLRCAIGFGLAILPVAAGAAAGEMQAAQVIECDVSDDGRPAVVTGLAITPDGRTIAAAGDDHHVTLWDTATGELRRRIGSHGDWVRSVSISADGSMLATGAGDRTVCIWNLGEQRRLFQLPACDSAIAAVCFHPDCHHLAIVGYCSSLQIVDVAAGKPTLHRDGPFGDLRTAAFGPSGSRLAVAGRKGPIRIWNVETAQPERDIETDGRLIRALAFSPDGRLLAAAGDSPEIYVFDAASGAELMTLSARPAKVFALVFLDNQQLAAGGSDNRIRIWDLETGTVTRELIGHTGTVAALACDRSGTTLVSGSYDTTLRVWHLDADAAPSVAQSPAETVR